jgi:hypothetical protein
VVYDASYVLRNLESGNVELRELSTARTKELADRSDARVRQPGRRRRGHRRRAVLPDRRASSQDTRADPPDLHRRRRVPGARRHAVVPVHRVRGVTLPNSPALPTSPARPAQPPRTAEATSGGGRNRLSATVAIIIAFATFVAAVAAFSAGRRGQSRRRSPRRGRAAEPPGLASSQSSRETSQVELETFQQWVEQRTNAGNALLGEHLCDERSGPSEQPAARGGALGGDRRGHAQAIGARP